MDRPSRSPVAPTGRASCRALRLRDRRTSLRSCSAGTPRHGPRAASASLMLTRLPSATSHTVATMRLNWSWVTTSSSTGRRRAASPSAPPKIRAVGLVVFRRVDGRHAYARGTRIERHLDGIAVVDLGDRGGEHRQRLGRLGGRLPLPIKSGARSPGFSSHGPWFSTHR